MGCELNSKIVYTEFSAVVRKQKEILKKLIEQKQAQVIKKPTDFKENKVNVFTEGWREKNPDFCQFQKSVELLCVKEL